ncbi:MAG: hypothetical protein AAF639_45620 [Chloroflexota bacterium]
MVNLNPLARISGQDKPAQLVLQNWLSEHMNPTLLDTQVIFEKTAATARIKTPIQGRAIGSLDNNSASSDYTQIDPSLSLAALDEHPDEHPDERLDKTTEGAMLDVQAFVAKKLAQKKLSTQPAQTQSTHEPKQTRLGVGYAGLTPEQRTQFLAWLQAPEKSASTLFYQLYVAYLEVRLFDGDEHSIEAHEELFHLHRNAAWHNHDLLIRALMLSYWLRRDHKGLVGWLRLGGIPAQWLGVVLGWLALWQYKLSFDELLAIYTTWQLVDQSASPDLLELRFQSLEDELGTTLLDHLTTSHRECFFVVESEATPDHEQVDATTAQPSDQQNDAPESSDEETAEATENKIEPTVQPDDVTFQINLTPWRCAHRDLRIALPQPDIRPILEPLLLDMLSVLTDTSDDVGVIAGSDDADNAYLGENTTDFLANLRARINSKHTSNAGFHAGQTVDNVGWHLILEFTQSRSEYFDYVLSQAQRLPTFVQIMDENRAMIYRIVFKRRDMRKFWRLWEYVQNWSGTHVYVNGKEIRTGQVYPRSPSLT